MFTLLHAQNVLFPVANYNSAADDRAAEFINFSWLLRSSDSNLTFFICNYNLDNGEACKTHRWTLLSISCVFLIVVSSTKDGYLTIHKLNSELKSKLKWYRLFLLYRKKRQKKSDNTGINDACVRSVHSSILLLLYSSIYMVSPYKNVPSYREHPNISLKRSIFVPFFDSIWQRLFLFLSFFFSIKASTPWWLASLLGHVCCFTLSCWLPAYIWQVMVINWIDHCDD